MVKTCHQTSSVTQGVQHSNSSLSSLQCYLFAYFSVWRNSKSFLALALICLSNMYLYELRNMWQILFHVAVGAFMTLQIRLRQPLGKAPDYNVWQNVGKLDLHPDISHVPWNCSKGGNDPPGSEWETKNVEQHDSGSFRSIPAPVEQQISVRIWRNIRPYLIVLETVHFPSSNFQYLYF